MSRANIVGQLSLFDTPPVAGGVSATCLWEYDPAVRDAGPPTPQMKSRFYHYLVCGRVYAGVFVGTGEVA